MADQPIWPGPATLTAAQVLNAADKTSPGAQAFTGSVDTSGTLEALYYVLSRSGGSGNVYLGYDVLQNLFTPAVSIGPDLSIARTAAGVATVKNSLVALAGVGAWGHAPPAAQPAAPVTLADVIAIIRGCGLSA